VSQQSTGQKREFLPIIIVGVILAALCGISLYIRIALPHDKIFVDGAVWFRETDAYYYIRNIESLVRHFPQINSFDPYMLYPGGGGGPPRPFFAQLVAAVVLLVSRGAPTLHTIEVVGAYMPAILGTLTLIPVYFIGKELFNRWAGVIAAALVVILPGEFLHRSLLGFTDHHVAETLFSTLSYNGHKASSGKRDFLQTRSQSRLANYHQAPRLHPAGRHLPGSVSPFLEWWADVHLHYIYLPGDSVHRGPLEA
jgi:asparagine N-glycosylation enzyme membrane subunit Stt3